jgi:hexosaminidase
VRTSWGISQHVLNLTAGALDFCRQVLDHVCALFPGELIGIGGDECPTDKWQGADREPWFVAQLAAHLRVRLRAGAARRGSRPDHRGAGEHLD